MNARAYTMSDRGTYLALQGRLDLPILVEGDKAVHQHLSRHHPQSRERPEHQFGRWRNVIMTFLLDPATQEFIGQFGVEKFGEPLFTPCAQNGSAVEAVATPAA